MPVIGTTAGRTGCPRFEDLMLNLKVAHAPAWRALCYLQLRFKMSACGVWGLHAPGPTANTPQRKPLLTHCTKGASLQDLCLSTVGLRHDTARWACAVSSQGSTLLPLLHTLMHSVDLTLMSSRHGRHAVVSIRHEEAKNRLKEAQALSLFACSYASRVKV